MSIVRLHCPVCDKRLKLCDEPGRGGSIVCPRCANRFAFTSPTTPTAVPAGVTPVPEDFAEPLPEEVTPARGVGPVVGMLIGVLTAGLLLAGVTAGLTLILRPAEVPVPAEEVATSLPPDPVEPPPMEPLAPVVRPPEASWLPREQQQKVHAAMERGLAYLRKQQRPGGSFDDRYTVGLAALPGLTLLECGVKPADAAVQKAAAHVRATAPGLSNSSETYELSLALLFLDRLADPVDRPRIRDLALRLAAGQQADGGWSYRCPPLSADEAPSLLDFLARARDPELQRQAPGAAIALPAPVSADSLRRVRAALPARLRTLPVVEDRRADKDERFRSGGSDNSNTQFATLALWAARRNDVPVERSLDLVGRRFRATQGGNGSWGYHAHGGTGTPAMTGVGLLGLAVGHGVRVHSPDEPPKRDPAIDRGLAALARHLGDPKGKRGGEVNLYFLWTVERVGVLYKLRSIEGKEWYPRGADELLPRQKADGSWHEGIYHGSTPLLDTALALLFLSRANLTTDLSDQLERLVRVR